MPEPVVSAALVAESIRGAIGLVDRRLNSIRNRDDQICGRIVYQFTVASVYMQTYCNQVLRVHVPLQGFSLEWPPPRRAELRDAWTGWRVVYAFLPEMERVKNTLIYSRGELPTHWRESQDDQRRVAQLQEKLVGTLGTFLCQVAYPIRDDKMGIVPEDFDGKDQKIRDASERAVNLVERKGFGLVTQAGTTAVQVREIVLSKRPGLPREIWGPLDALAFPG